MIAALRQPAIQSITTWVKTGILNWSDTNEDPKVNKSFLFFLQITYVPLALFIPPPIFVVHLQMIELFGVWYHSAIIPKLGPIEWIFVTASHHRVHHARNPKYIDKNFGGVLIIWDRLFGTFEEEDEDEPVVYGLVHPVSSFNPFWIQFHHFVAIWNRIKDHKCWKEKLFVLIKGTPTQSLSEA